MGVSIESVRSELRKMRAKPETKRQFPNQLWENILDLTDKHTVGVVSEKLGLSKSYLYKKLDARKPKEPKFCEVKLDQLKEKITIDLELGDLKARIQGPHQLRGYHPQAF